MSIYNDNKHEFIFVICKYNSIYEYVYSIFHINYYQVNSINIIFSNIVINKLMNASRVKKKNRKQNVKY